ncbi:GNAT family N-acetyltransferase [Streptomyces daliensis]|uniref:GNAT family N-acetyltransferase n=1 Tax=Streptomyces daliensis TaxID=299421 RepID=A0A8T4IWM8_9ACTN|nr:GNAT family N-acetyltransferase [Streptomyces daliensis]
MISERHVRPARSDDAPELVRLRRLMFAAMRGRDEPGDWERAAEKALRRFLSEPEGERRFGAFVVDADEDGGGAMGPRLAACAVGTVEERLAAPPHPDGLFGFVFNVCTDAHHRGRGYARDTTRALLDWFADRGVTRVDLHATPEAEGLYRGLGFTTHSIPLSLDLPARGR